MQAGPLCCRCGEALAFDPIPGVAATCRVCSSAEPAFARAVAHGVYEGTLRTLLHLLKYDGMGPVARPLGVLLANRLAATPNLPADLLVVPVPLYGGKSRQRGFNQAELLARATVAAVRRRRPEMRLRVVAGALERRRATESQAGLSPHQRRVNVRGAFFVSRPEAVSGRDLLLVDDIYTTGATARACSLALKQAGARSVWVGTVARAQWRSPSPFAEPASRHDAEAGGPELPMEEDFALWEEGRTAQAVGTER